MNLSKQPTATSYASKETMGDAPELEWIPVAQMFVDPEYQRSTETANGRSLIETIAREFQWAKFQVVVVTRRSDGMYAVIDGQHRRAAAIKCGLESLPCLVVSPGSLQAEADIFVSVNSGRVAVQPYEMFWSKLAAGRPDALAIKAVCDRAGVTIPRSLPKAANTSHKRLSIPPKATIAIAAISASIRLYGEEIAVEALSILADAFPNKEGQIRQGAIKGLGVFLKRQSGRFNRSELVSALGRRDMAELEVRASADREKYSNRADLSMAAQIALICPPPSIVPPGFHPPPRLVQPAPARTSPVRTASEIGHHPLRGSLPVNTAIDKSIITCGCKRQFRPERPGQAKCNICLDKYSSGEPIEVAL